MWKVPWTHSTLFSGSSLRRKCLILIWAWWNYLAPSGWYPTVTEINKKYINQAYLFCKAPHFHGPHVYHTYPVCMVCCSFCVHLSFNYSRRMEQFGLQPKSLQESWTEVGTIHCKLVRRKWSDTSGQNVDCGGIAECQGWCPSHMLSITIFAYRYKTQAIHTPIKQVQPSIQLWIFVRVISHSGSTFVTTSHMSLPSHAVLLLTYPKCPHHWFITVACFSDGSTAELLIAFSWASTWNTHKLLDAWILLKAVVPFIIIMCTTLRVNDRMIACEPNICSIWLLTF